MDELRKVKRVIERAHCGAPHEVLLVLDGNQGQNALAQAEQFHAALGVTGIVITKLDGTARGGIVVAIHEQLGIPVKLVGLGEGTHFGEWWGGKIQRGYGLKERRFSLFNVSRWCDCRSEPLVFPTSDPRVTRTQERAPECCSVVPTLFRGKFDTDAIEFILGRLRVTGSVAAPGFMRPEGVVVFHEASGTLFKKTLEKDEAPKSRVGAIV